MSQVLMGIAIVVVGIGIMILLRLRLWRRFLYGPFLSLFNRRSVVENKRYVLQRRQHNDSSAWVNDETIQGRMITSLVVILSWVGGIVFLAAMFFLLLGLGELMNK